MMRFSANMTNDDQSVKPMEVKHQEGSDRGCRVDRNNRLSHAAWRYLFENMPRAVTRPLDALAERLRG
jgi:hypothetical protein